MRTRTILVAMALTTLGFSATQAQEAARDSSDEQVIRKSVDEYCAAFNHGDVDAVMTFWADDADYVDEQGETHRGKDAIGALFKDAAENMKGYTLKLKIDGLRLVKPEVAIEDGIAELTSPEGKLSSGHYTAVWTKSGDKWLINSARELAAEKDADTLINADHLKSLEWLVGQWSSDDQGPPVSLTSKWALDKSFLVQEYTVAGKDGADMHVMQWIGFDPSTEQIKAWTFDSRGGFSEGVWSREDNSWQSETTGVLPDGRIGSSLNSIHFIDDTHFEWRSTGRNVEGQPMPDTEVRFVRNDNSEKTENP